MKARIGLVALIMTIGAAGSSWAGACAKAAMYGGNSAYWNTMCMWDWIVDFLVM